MLAGQLTSVFSPEAHRARRATHEVCYSGIVDNNPAQQNQTPPEPPTHNGVPLDVTPDPALQPPPSTVHLTPPSQNAPIPPKLKEQGGAQLAAEPAATPTSGEADKIAKEEGDEYWENYAREI